MGKKVSQPGLFDLENRLEKVSKSKSSLEWLLRVIDFSLFAPLLTPLVKSNEKVGGRPAYDRVMLFKCLIIAELYSLSDDELEYQLLDRLSFQRFLGLGLHQSVPDAKTLWAFREQATKEGVLDKCFVSISVQLKQAGLVLSQGKIIDSTVVPTHRRQMKADERQALQEGTLKEARRRQLDPDTRYTGHKKTTGYKNHVVVDQGSGLITDFNTTDAAWHDSQMLEPLLDTVGQGEALLADSGYDSSANREVLTRLGIGDGIMDKAYRNKPLTEQETERNNLLSKTRCRIEHVFASMKRGMRGWQIRSVGLARATARITLRNMAYNLRRLSWLIGQGRAQALGVAS